MVHRREVEGEVLTFGNQGALWGNAMTWWDHDTGSVWSQPLGEAIIGPRKGQELELMAAKLTRLGSWLEDHPDSLALDVPASPPVFRLSDMTIVVDFSDEVGVYRFDRLATNGPANDVVAGVPIAVAADFGDLDRWSVFLREVDGHVLEFVSSDGEIADTQTGTIWNLSTGRALEGPLLGRTLDQLPAFTAFASDVETFWPEAKIWGEE